MPRPSPAANLPRNAQETDDRETWAQAAQVSLVTAVAALLRFHHLGGLPLWYDEAVTEEFTRLSWRELLFNFEETNPPLFFALVKLWAGVFGNFETSLRTTAAIAGIATIPVVYSIGRLLRGHWVGLLAAALLALSSIHIYYSQEARTFTLLMLACAVATWGTVRFMRTREASFSSLAVYAGASSLALHAHNTAVIYLALINLAALVWWLREGKRDRSAALGWFTANAVAVLSWSWWLPFVASQFVAEYTRFSWIEQPWPGEALRTATGVLGMDFTAEPALAAVVFAALALVGITTWRGGGTARIALAILFVGAPLLTYAIGFYRPLFIPRAIVWPIFVGCILAAAAVMSLRGRMLQVAAAAVALLIQIPATAAYFNLESKDGEPWHQVAAYIRAQDGADTAIVLCPNWYRGPLLYYLRGRPPAATLLGTETGERSGASPPGRMAPLWPEEYRALPERFRRVIVVKQMHCQIDEIGADMTAAFGGALRFVETRRFQLVEVRRFERR